MGDSRGRPEFPAPPSVRAAPEPAVFPRPPLSADGGSHSSLCPASAALLRDGVRAGVCLSRFVLRLSRFCPPFVLRPSSICPTVVPPLSLTRTHTCRHRNRAGQPTQALREIFHPSIVASPLGCTAYCPRPFRPLLCWAMPRTRAAGKRTLTLHTHKRASVPRTVVLGLPILSGCPAASSDQRYYSCAIA